MNTTITTLRERPELARAHLAPPSEIPGFLRHASVERAVLGVRPPSRAPGSTRVEACPS